MIDPMVGKGAITMDVPLSPFIREADYTARPPWIIPERRLLDYLLIMVDQGTCRFVVDSQTYLVEPDQVFLGQPRDCITLQGLTPTLTPYIHCDLFDQPGREERFSPGPGFLDLTLYQHLVQPRLNDVLQIALPALIQVPNPSQFRDQLVACIGLWQTRTQINRIEANMLLGSLIVTLLRANAHDDSVTAPAPSILQSLDVYLRQRVHESITVQEMADYTNMSVASITRLCRRGWKQSPHQRLLYLRLLHARTLLHNPCLSIARIAEYCGFADTQHFAHVFHKRFMCTPTQARLTLMRGQEDDQLELASGFAAAMVPRMGSSEFPHDGI